MSNRIEVLKPTQDDWCGSYVINDWFEGVRNQMFVQVVFNGNISPPGSVPTWRTCVWGDDDMGMEFDSASEAEAFNKFLQVIGWKFVNQQALRDLGFVSA